MMAWSLIEVLDLPKLLLGDSVLLPELPFSDVPLENLDSIPLFEAVVTV